MPKYELTNGMSIASCVPLKKKRKKCKQEWQDEYSIHSDVRLSYHDCATNLKVTFDALTVEGMKGYRSIRATHGVKEGHMYFEIKINKDNSDKLGYKDVKGHCRVGWSTIDEQLEAPVGFSKNSYSYGDVGGKRFHQSIGEPYGSEYGVDDIIGCEIILINEKSEKNVGSNGVEKHAQDGKMTRSTIIFYKNGKSQGIAFKDMHQATYYPTISLYMGMCVTVNFGKKYCHTTENAAMPNTKNTSEKIIDQIVSTQNTNNTSMKKDNNENDSLDLPLVEICNGIKKFEKKLEQKWNGFHFLPTKYLQHYNPNLIPNPKHFIHITAQ